MLKKDHKKRELGLKFVGIWTIFHRRKTIFDRRKIFKAINGHFQVPFLNNHTASHDISVPGQYDSYLSFSWPPLKQPNHSDSAFDKLVDLIWDSCQLDFFISDRTRLKSSVTKPEGQFSRLVSYVSSVLC